MWRRQTEIRKFSKYLDRRCMLAVDRMATVRALGAAHLAALSEVMMTSSESTVSTQGRWAPWSIGAFLSVVVAILSARYLVHVGFFPDIIVDNLFISPWLIVHVAGAAWALL